MCFHYFYIVIICIYNIDYLSLYIEICRYLRSFDNYHIKVDWETHQIFLKYRDKLFVQWRAPPHLRGIYPGGLQRAKALKSCHSEFHRILWCGYYSRYLLPAYFNFRRILYVERKVYELAYKSIYI